MSRDETTAPEAPDLMDRRLPQAAAAYVALAWGLVEILQFAVERYGLPAQSLHLGVGCLVAGFPASMILTWRHGLPGAQRTTLRELGLAGAAFVVTFAIFRETARPLAAPAAPAVPPSSSPRTPAAPPVALADPAAFVDPASLPGQLGKELTLQVAGKTHVLSKVAATVGKLTGTNIVVESALGGLPVEVKLPRMPAVAVLDALCRLADAEWVVRKDLIEVVRRKPDSPAGRLLDLDAPGFPLAAIAELLEARSVYRVEVGEGVAGRVVHLRARRVSLDAALRAVARRAGVRVVLAGRTLRLEDAPGTPREPHVLPADAIDLEFPAPAGLVRLERPVEPMVPSTSTLATPIRLSRVEDIPLGKVVATIGTLSGTPVLAHPAIASLPVTMRIVDLRVLDALAALARYSEAQLEEHAGYLLLRKDPDLPARRRVVDLVAEGLSGRAAASLLEVQSPYLVEVDPALAARPVTVRALQVSLDEALAALAEALGARLERRRDTLFLRARG